MLKKAVLKGAAALMLALVLTTALCGCGRRTGASPTAAPAASPEAGAENVRQDGERFEGVILLEGMEETVRYEHVRDDALGFALDYEYETLLRRREAQRERFISVYDDPEKPENYLELTYRPESADAVRASIAEALSKTYIVTESPFTLDRAGACTRIAADLDRVSGGTPDQMQMVYVIPAPGGCLVAAAHYGYESAEGFGGRFRSMMHTLTLVDRSGGGLPG